MNIKIQPSDMTAAFEAVPHFPNYLSERAQTGAPFEVVASGNIGFGKGCWRSVSGNAVRMYSERLAAHLEIVLGPRGTCTVTFEPDKGKPQHSNAHYSATPTVLTITNFRISLGAVTITAFNEIYRWKKVETYINAKGSPLGIYIKEPEAS